jgi:IclR family transcriptional regulator, pca regulon regulatory protein
MPAPKTLRAIIGYAMGSMALPAGDPDFVLSLARGLQVIEAFHEKTGGLTVSEGAARTGLSRAAVRRLLITLESLGYAERKESTFRLTSRILRLGFSFISSSSLASLSLPILEQLSAHIRESCSVSLLDGAEIVYVARTAPKRVMTIDLGVGSRLPAYCTSMGRVLLAALSPAEFDRYLAQTEFKAHTTKTICEREELMGVIEQVRLHGYALVDEELELGLRSIAVPVVSQTGRVVAAMNSGVHAARVSCLELVDRILPALRDHARMLGQMLP